MPNEGSITVNTKTTDADGIAKGIGASLQNYTSQTNALVERVAYVKCVDCDGMGFLRTGDFANRAFPRCVKCGGHGQIYPPAKPVGIG